MPLANQASAAHGRVDYEVHDFLAILGAADLLQVTWPENGMRHGFDVFMPPLCANPNTLSVGVRNRKEAFALRAARSKSTMGTTTARIWRCASLKNLARRRRTKLCRGT
jgi:hypothetical protein